MKKEIKSGKEILEDFFSEIQKLNNIDKDIVGILGELYKQDKFSDTNIINELDKLREKKKDEN